MGISRADLEKLRNLVATNRPLAPSQAMALREIVDQVYQATDPYEPIDNHSGFLGVPLPPNAIIADANDDDSQSGMLVTSRIHGFCAYRFLQDGDMIVAINDRPIRTGRDLSEIIAASRGGDMINVEIVRGGQHVHVQFKLDVRPNWASQQLPLGQTTTQDNVRERQRKADEYWDQNFATLLDGGLL
jgi:hypothetical protein